MTRRDLWPLLSLGALALSGCNSAPRTIRYRLTLDVDTPDGLKTGSGVIQITMNYNDGLLKGLGNLVNPVFVGEAVSVDLGSRGILFCLLSRDEKRKGSPQDPSALVSSWLPDQDKTGSLSSFYDSMIRHKPKGEIPPDRLPLLVRFRDINDPKSIERVDPSNLAASFGPGVQLVRATIQITDDPVTKTMEKIIPWWNGPFPWLKPLRQGVYIDTRTEAFRFQKDDFQQGI